MFLIFYNDRNTEHFNINKKNKINGFPNKIRTISNCNMCSNFCNDLHKKTCCEPMRYSHLYQCSCKGDEQIFYNKNKHNLLDGRHIDFIDKQNYLLFYNELEQNHLDYEAINSI